LRDAGHERQRMSLNRLIAEANKAWHGVRLNQPDWSDHSHSVAFTAELKREKLLIHLILNGYWEPLDFELPPTATTPRPRGAGGLIPPLTRRTISFPGARPDVSRTHLPGGSPFSSWRCMLPQAELELKSNN